MDDPTMQPIIAAEPRRRWLHFGLRRILFAVALLGSLLSIVATRANRQRMAVETITKSGGSVWYDFQTDNSGNGSGTTGSAVYLDNPPPGPAWLRQLIGIDYFANVVGASIYDGSAYDETGALDNGSVALEELPRLRAVILSRKCITNDTMVRLRKLADLRYLTITDSSVTDAGWRSLEDLPHLKGLILGGSNVNDTTLSHVKGLTELRHLSVGQTCVTDAGLRYVEGLPQLTMVEVSLNDKITADGVRELKRARPTLEIIGP
jgi:hypothetical protein